LDVEASSGPNHQEWCSGSAWLAHGSKSWVSNLEAGSQLHFSKVTILT